MDECPGHVISCDFGEAKASLEPCPSHTLGIDGYS
jgi:hypothetical protein